jgi:hypothetical protein
MEAGQQRQSGKAMSAWEDMLLGRAYTVAMFVRRNRGQSLKTSRRQPLKTYLYISDIKVDMLYEQLPKVRRRELNHELKLDLKLVSYSIALSPQPGLTRLARLAAVCRHLDASGAGSVDDPRLYFYGSMPMKHGRYPASPDGPRDVAFFVGQSTNGRWVTLGGTAHHLVGSTGERPWSNSGVAQLMKALRTESYHNYHWESYYRSRNLAIPPNSSGLGLPGAWESEAHEVWEKHPGPEQNLEFVAVKLAAGSLLYDVLLGSPIYVALQE